MKKINSTILIDDDEPTNYLNKYIIKRSKYSEDVVTFHKPKEALQFLRENKSNFPDKSSQNPVASTDSNRRRHREVGIHPDLFGFIGKSLQNNTAVLRVDV